MRTKQANNIAETIADIYKAGPLTYPKVSQSDNESEFKALVTKMLQRHGVKIRHTKTKYKHTHMAFVEALNKLLTEKSVQSSGWARVE